MPDTVTNKTTTPAAPAAKTITSAGVTNMKPPIPTVSEVEIPDSQIEARPLTLPGAFNIKLKNPNLSARGVNFVVQRGQRLTEAKVLGYRVAQQIDVVTAPGWSWIDGAFRMGDLMLMVMGRREYIGAIKSNEETSLRRASRKKLSQHDQQDIHAATQSRVAPSNREYVKERVEGYDPADQIGEAKLEEVINQAGNAEPLVPLPDDFYGKSEQHPRIINKSQS
jgi:hypothetical protein